MAKTGILESVSMLLTFLGIFLGPGASGEGVCYGLNNLLSERKRYNDYEILYVYSPARGKGK